MFITIWMFGTSVLYPVSGVGGAAGLLLRLNPMTPIIDAYRDILFSNEWPLAPEFLVAAVISIAVFAMGWLAFHRSEFAFAENV